MVCPFFLFDNRHGSFVEAVEKKGNEFFRGALVAM